MLGRRALEGRSPGPAVLLSLLLHGGLGLGLLATATRESAARAEARELTIELWPWLAAPPSAREPALAPAAGRAPPPPPRAAHVAARAGRASTRREPLPAPLAPARTGDPASAAMPASTATDTARDAARSTATPLAPEAARQRLPAPEAAGSRAATAGPYAPGAVSEQPRLLVQPTPRYPARALRLGIDADVVLALIVEASGDVSGARVVRAAGHGFDEAALAAARHLRFAPGRAGGAAVAVRVTWTCRFRANG